MDAYQLQFILSLLAYAAQRNVSPERLCVLSGIDIDRLKTQPTTITPWQVNDLWLNASQLSHDPLFGLHFGESMQAAALGVVGQIIQTSRTVGEALTQAATLTHLLTDFLVMDVTQSDDRFTVRFLPNRERAGEYPFIFRQLMDFCFAFVLHEIDGLVLKKLKPMTVMLPHTESDRAEYERVLRCPLTQTTDVYTLEFDGRYWHEPILTANYELQQVLLQKAGTLNRTVEGSQFLKERVCAFLSVNAYLGIPTLDDIAANFNTSARSLQRKLQEEGVTYQELADSIRKSLAVQYVESGKYPVKEVSYILGYNELSAFTRAFKRWTGVTPTSYQRLD